MGRKERITEEVISETQAHKTCQDNREFPLPLQIILPLPKSHPNQASKHGVTSEISLPLGRDETGGEDPPCGAGTQGRLKAKGGTKILRKTPSAYSPHTKHNVTLEKYEATSVLKVTIAMTKLKLLNF